MQKSTEALIKQWKGKVCEESKTKNGSRNLQNVLGDDHSQIMIKFFIDEILENLEEVMCDSYGNYFF
jgi:hypothetical protein